MSSWHVCILSIILVQAFLTKAALRGGKPEPQVNIQMVESSLLTVLSSAVKGNGDSKISGLEAALRPMYKALPLEEDGSISHPVVRYVLHRFFTKKHGWFIRGLEPNSATQPSSGTENLAEWVPSYLQKFLEEIQGGNGITLRELAVLAATLEDLIHKEAVGRLQMTFKALELPEVALLDHERLAQALEVYMMIFMLGGNFTIVGQENVLAAHKVFVDQVKDWGNVQNFMHSIQIELFPDSDDRSLNFSAATKVVEEGGRRFGAYNDHECRTLKARLLEIESTKAGRVRLSEFYRASLEGVFEFNEKQDYLRMLGVLDESNMSDPHVIVPNYVVSRPNCLDASKLYVVCCLNECEDLLGQLESRSQLPTAKSDQILEQVASMSSKTVEAPRKLSDSLVQRLHQLAQANGGLVPLHGRLFAQWMHHAYPRECPYPQKAATTNPQSPDEWMQATGEHTARNTPEEVQAHVAVAEQCTMPKGAEAREQQHLKENELPWDHSEELPDLMFAAGELFKSENKKAVPTTRIAPPLRVDLLLFALASFLKKLAAFFTITFCLAFVAWRVTASGTGKDGEPMTPVTFVRYLRRKYGSSPPRASMLECAQRSSSDAYC